MFVPAPAKAPLAVNKAPPEDQEVPLYVSVFPKLINVHPDITLPPKAKAAVFVPAPAKLCLAVIKAPPEDQEVPLYDSVQPTADGD